MKLLPLRPIAPRAFLYDGETDIAATIRVCCLKTGQRSPVWNDACAAGWVYDAEGAAFASYYSPDAAASLTPEEAASLAQKARSLRLTNHPLS